MQIYLPPPPEPNPQYSRGESRRRIGSRPAGKAGFGLPTTRQTETERLDRPDGCLSVFPLSLALCRPDRWPSHQLRLKVRPPRCGAPVSDFPFPMLGECRLGLQFVRGTYESFHLLRGGKGVSLSQRRVRRGRFYLCFTLFHFGQGSDVANAGAQYGTDWLSLYV